MTGVLKGEGLGPILSKEEARMRLDAMSVDDLSADWMMSDFMGTTDLAKALSVSVGKIRDWRRKRSVIAFRLDCRGYVYPLRQFVNGKPVKGLDGIIPFFNSPEDAWEWLVAYNLYTGKQDRIDALRTDEVEAVTRAAESAAWSAYV